MIHWNPNDDEPDVIEEAEAWLKRYSEDNKPNAVACSVQDARSVIEGLLGYIKDEI